jgi:diacylglycerol kinase family enzyme
LNKSAFVEIKQGRDILLDFPHAMPYHIDGEALAPSQHFKIEIKPSSLKMTVPEKTWFPRKYPI